ncbi:hypothetical protein [Bradyrhizobium prioriisuperbiae]|uniref:hypothetical protein n=1 Tax=Bradyrhizobium prioriisuperbiae TaxID=2854389 RepID=UPI0028EA9072|nr:hypothetical protein [Bradyrhizobium prioritasuperba]
MRRQLFHRMSRWRRVAGPVVALLISFNLVQFNGYVRGWLPHNNATRADYLGFWTWTLHLPWAP